MNYLYTTDQASNASGPGDEVGESCNQNRTDSWEEGHLGKSLGENCVNKMLTPIEAGLYLNLHARTVSRLAKQGLIPAFKVGRRWRFKKTALNDWLSGDRFRDENAVKLTNLCRISSRAAE